MGKVLIISLLLLSGIGAAAQGGSSGPSQIVYDSLATDLEDLEDLPLLPPASSASPLSPLPSGLSHSGAILPLPSELPGLSFGGAMLSGESWRTLRGGVILPGLPAPSIRHPLPVEFATPDKALFLSYDRFRRQEGITIPVHSVNRGRMIASGRGYMPLLIRGDHALGLAGSRQRYPSMGFSNSVSAGYAWRVTDGITLYGNVNVSDNMYHLTRFKDIGVSGRMRIQVADGLFLNGYGSYSIYNGAGTQGLPPLMYPMNSFGGSIEVKVTDRFGLEGGAQRGYNAFTRQWETSYYVLPVFY